MMFPPMSRGLFKLLNYLIYSEKTCIFTWISPWFLYFYHGLPYDFNPL